MIAGLRRFLSPILGTRPPADLIWITPELAQSGWFASHEAPALSRLAIGAVLDLRSDERHRLAPLGKAGLHYLHLPSSEQRTPSEDELARAADWVLQEMGDDRKVLVHCQPHMARGLAVVAAVLLRMGYPLSQAVTLLRQRHPDATLGGPQLTVLRRYADSLER